MFPTESLTTRRGPYYKIYADLIDAVAVSGEGWQIWRKPKGINTVHITCIGSGGGGGGGRSGAGGTQRGGGSGGGTGAMMWGVYPAIALPDTLYIQLGKGGDGGAVNTNGSAGSTTYVSFARTTDVNSLLMLVRGGGAGQAGVSGAGSAAGGSGASTTTSSDFALGAVGIWNAMAGQGTGAGGAGSGAAAPGATLGWIVGGGRGGGGTGAGNGANAGGYVDIPSSGGSLVRFRGGESAGEDGMRGFIYAPRHSKMMWFLPGTGGCSDGTSTGGKGGSAKAGGGGGGGGAGVTAGVGGQGGCGVVIISCA